MSGKSLNVPRMSLTSSFSDKNPLYALFIFHILEKNVKKIFFSREAGLPNFVQKRFYSNTTGKRAEPAYYQTTEANIIGNI